MDGGPTLRVIVIPDPIKSICTQIGPDLPRVESGTTPSFVSRVVLLPRRARSYLSHSD